MELGTVNDVDDDERRTWNDELDGVGENKELKN